MSYSYDHLLTSNTADAVIFSWKGDKLYVLLIRRGREGEPFYDQWALPGGYLDVEKDIDLEACCRRELYEETGVKLDYMQQLHTYSRIDRDPRGRVISTAFFAIVDHDIPIKAADDAKEIKWCRVARITQPLAFDHMKMIFKGARQITKGI